MLAVRECKPWERAACALLFLALSQGRPVAQEIAPGAFAPIFDGVRVAAEPAGSSTRPPNLHLYTFLGGRDWPAIRFHASKPQDWSRAGALALEVENPADRPFELILRVDDDPRANGDERSLTGTVTLAPHQRTTLLMPLDGGPLGMLARPPEALAVSSGEREVSDVRGSVDLRHVVALHISGVRAEADHDLWLGAPALRPKSSPAGRPPLLDRFGQAVAGAWPEKVASDAELRARLREAEAQTRALARTALRSADGYGGVDTATRLPAAGFFRTLKMGSRWSLVTPAGHRFFSLGVDGVAPSNPTRVTGRTGMFQALPPVSGPLGQFYGTSGEAETFDFGAADLERSFGPQWRSRWVEAVRGRLRAWGFNTLGNWSDETVGQQAMPYVSFFDFEGNSAEVPMGARNLPDPFDPAFASVADAAAQAMTTSRRSDPFLIGYFSGNELPWGSADRPGEGIAARVLALGRDSPAKQALVEGLRRRYGSIRALASAWSIDAPPDWNGLLDQPVSWPVSLTSSAKQDIKEFQGRFAELYFRTVRQAIKRHDPNHLYLGTRFANFTPEIVEACAHWCDVLSFNVYARSPEQAASAWRGFDRPVLIGEFHFGSNDRGPFWPGMIDAGSEKARGPAYAAYVSGAVRDPDIVGCHWFRYADEPATGVPYDGENGHIGLVGITDVPFGGFVAAVAAANRRALDDFAKQDRLDSRLELKGTR